MNPTHPTVHSERRPRCFANACGVWRLRIQGTADLRHLLDMDEALWAASSAPVDGLHFDKPTLSFLDADGDRRIRCEELRAAVRWFFQVLKASPPPNAAEDGLLLDELDTETPQGREVHAAAIRTLENTGRALTSALTLADVTDRKRLLAATGSNGDGVITPTSVEDNRRLVTLVETIMTAMGAVPDVSGQDGVDAERINRFYQALRDYVRWLDQGWTPDTSTEPNLSMFPANSWPDAAAAVRQVQDKLDDYFALADMARYDGRAATAANPGDSEWGGLQGRTSADLRELLAKGPVAPVSDNDHLVFEGPINPVFAPALMQFRERVWRGLFPRSEQAMSREQWCLVRSLFKAYEERMADNKGAAVEGLGIETIRDLLANDDRDDLLSRVAQDIAAGADIAAVSQVEKLLRFKQHLTEFANNYVAFPDFYDFNRKAAFEMGTLIMNGRRFTLCVHVDLPAEHGAIAKLAGIYLMYCELSRHDTPEKRRVAVAVTAGNTREIYVGKRGVFCDRSGRYWDARVTSLIENHISLAEALWAPFKRFGEVISSQIEKLTASREKSIEKEFDAGFSQVSQTVDAGPPTAAASPASNQNARPIMGGSGGMFVGGSVAVAALGTSFAFISKTFSEIGRINFLYTAAVILLIILLPTLILALLRLRARDISNILEACGWAINGRMRLTLRLARILSYAPGLPPDAFKCGTFAMNPPGWLRCANPSRRRLVVLLGLLAVLALGCLISRYFF